jgi:outer membrane lipoprotein carrier protein
VPEEGLLRGYNQPMNIHRFMWLVLCGLGMNLGAGQALASSLDRFNSFLAATQSAAASFEQTIYDRSKKVVQESRGTLAFQRPGKFRWTYVKPYPQLIVGDGVKVWIYDEDLNQVTVRRLDQALGSTPAALLAGNNEVVKAFRLSDLGVRDGLEWLEAAPRGKEGSFDKLRLGFGFSGLERMELEDSFGQTTVMRFTVFERNPKLDAATFKFSTPKGADVLGDTK